jgi:hypothetical protein
LLDHLIKASLLAQGVTIIVPELAIDPGQLRIVSISAEIGGYNRVELEETKEVAVPSSGEPSGCRGGVERFTYGKVGPYPEGGRALHEA